MFGSLGRRSTGFLDGRVGFFHTIRTARGRVRDFGIQDPIVQTPTNSLCFSGPTTAFYFRLTPQEFGVEHAMCSKCLLQHDHGALYNYLRYGCFGLYRCLYRTINRRILLKPGWRILSPLPAYQTNMNVRNAFVFDYIYRLYDVDLRKNYHPITSPCKQ